jgi:hypothetical protein
MPSNPIHKPGVLVLLFIFILLTATTGSYGQTDCIGKIQEAQKYYDQGMIEEIRKCWRPAWRTDSPIIRKLKPIS